MAEAVRRHTRELVWRSLIALPIVALLAFQFSEARSSAGRRVGIIVELEKPPLIVVEMKPDGPAALGGIRAGDVIRRLDGREIRDAQDYDRAAQGFERGVPVAFEVDRDGTLVTCDVVPGMAVDWSPLLLHALMVSLFLVMGLLALARRPGSLPSRLLFWFFVLLAAEVALPSLVIGAPAVTVASTTAFYLIVALQFGTSLHLASLVPRRADWLRRRPWILPAYYGAGLVLGLLTCATYVVEVVLESDLLPWGFDALFNFVNGGWLVIWASSLLAILLLAIVRHPGRRGRLHAGLVLLGLLPWALYVYALQAMDWMGLEVPGWVDEYWSLTLLLFPLSIFVMLRLEDAVRGRLLRNLIEEVQEAGSIENVSRLISEKLNLAFYTKCNYVFFRESHDSELSSIHTSGSDLDVEQIPRDYKILGIADRKGATLVYPDDVAEPLPAAEKDWLDCLQANLIVPLVESGGHMMGLLILGQKRSEEPYTPDDLELLHALARQVTMAHENLALQLKVHERDRVQREVLDRLAGQEISPVKECPVCGFCFDTRAERCPRDGGELTLTLPVERIIDGRYRLEQVLGRGGAAVVYLASDERLDRGVAVKVLALSLLDDVMAPRRFEREARVAAQLLHPNIVTTHDFGKTYRGLPYIVMEHLVGRTLRQILKQDGCLEGATAAEWFGQILDGLGAAHALGVVHRDLKPDNVFMAGCQPGSAECVVKLLDFGLAKIRTRSQDDSFTSPGTILGTLSYMAPEQLAGEEADRRADLYAVGVMAYEAMTGRRPFEGRSPAQILTSILQGGFHFPEKPHAGDLRQVLERCLDQKRERRYRSVAELRAELIPALEACPRLVVVKPAARGGAGYSTHRHRLRRPGE